MKLKSFLAAVTWMLTTTLLTACGGGGGGGSNPPPPGGGTNPSGTLAYSIGGTVTGLTGAGLVLQNNGGDNLSVSADGGFTFSTKINNGGAYSVTVLTQPSGQTCTVASGAGTVSGANVTNVAVNCINNPAGTYTLGGTVSGLTGVGLILQNNGSDNLSVSANGGFTFATALANGSAYSATVLTQPAGQTCTVASGAGTVAAANVSTVAVTCAASSSSGAPAAPTLALGYGIKQLKFTWSAVSGATYYQLFENPDGVSGYPQVGSDLTATAYDHDIALYRRVNARYLLKACNSAGCTSSAEVFVSANLTAAIGYIKASNAGAGDYFGYAVALSGDGNTLAVSAAADSVGTVASNPGEDGGATGVGGDQSSNSAANSGAVYVYIRNGGTWETQAYVKATNTDVADNFGRSLDLSYDGNTLAVGATQEDGNGSSQADNSLSLSGAAYVYVRNSGVWSPQAYLKASNAGNQDYFGYSLALSADGNTLAVAAALEPSYTTGVGGTGTSFSENSGAVYVFVRNGAAWSEQGYIKATNAIVVSSVAKYFGWSLALSDDGNTLVVGAVGDDSGANGVNAPDSNPTCTVIACVADSGAVYVYSRSGTTWSGQAYIKATNTGGGDQFGYAVSLSGDGNTLAVGAPYEDSNATTIGGDQTNNSAGRSGAVYVYSRSSGSWLPESYVKALNSGANLQFGSALALNGDGSILAVGAPSESYSAIGVGGDPFKLLPGSGQSGATYTYVRNSGIWAKQAYVKASNTQTNDGFGKSLALSASGNTLAVGATAEDSKATGVGGDQSDNSVVNSGAVYLY